MLARVIPLPKESIDRYILQQFFGKNGVLPEKNTTKRAIRLQVVICKIFGSSRSLSGIKVHQVNTSVTETVRKRNPNSSFFDVILPLLKKCHSGL